MSFNKSTRAGHKNQRRGEEDNNCLDYDCEV